MRVGVLIHLPHYWVGVWRREISSTPSGAEIEIDGNFVGSTASIVGVIAGQRQLAEKKNGFKAWEKKVSISSGHVKTEAELETAPN